MFVEFYLKMFHLSTRLDDKKNYAQAAGIEFDIKQYIHETYLEA